jgi:hypothetical protein
VYVCVVCMHSLRTVHRYQNNALQSDALENSHPIEVEVASSSQACGHACALLCTMLVVFVRAVIECTRR